MLTDEQCNEFRRLPMSFNDMVRAIYEAGRASKAAEYADVPPATILTEHEMRDMLIACRSSVKFDMNQMELTALKPSLSAVSRDVADKEAQRLALLLGRIDALAGTE